MRIVTLLLSLFSLLQITYGNPVDCSTEIKGISPNFIQINGLWNMQSISALNELNLKVKGVVYGFFKVSANEKEANISVTYNPLSAEGGETTFKKGVHSDTGDLTYEVTAADGKHFTLTIVQPDPDSLMMYYRENGVYQMAILYYKEASLPPDVVDHFRKWSQCKNLLHSFDLDTSFHYGQECSGLFEESDDLDNIVNAINLNLVVKSSSSEDVFSSMKTMYTARLEVLPVGDKYTVREFKTKVVEYKEAEFNFIKGSNTDEIKISTFKTEKDMLLLGIRKGSSRTLYLASKTYKAEQQVLDTFLKQSSCFGNTYTYFVPGTRDKDHGVSCFGKIEDVTPLPVNQSLGRWNQAISALTLTKSMLNDVTNIKSALKIRKENGNFFLTDVKVLTTLPIFDDIPVEEKDGFLIFPGTSTPILQHFSRDCALHSDIVADTLALFCHSDIISFEDRVLFGQYAICQKYTNLVIKRQNALPCLNIPGKLKPIDQEKLSGKWKVEASATSISRQKVKVPTEMDFTVHDQQVIVLQNDRTKTTMEKDDNKFQDIVDKETFLVFHKSLGDSLLVWSGSKTDDLTAVYLLSKSSKLDPAEVAVFKDIASCMSFSDVIIHE